MKPFLNNLRLVIKHICASCINISLGFTLLLMMLCWLKWVGIFFIQYQFYQFWIFIHFLNSNFTCNPNELLNLIWFDRCIWFWVIYWIFKKCYIGCMPYFFSGDYVYSNDNEEEPKRCHKIFILIQENKLL